jgi:CheY-like chemotaxis protein
MRNVFALVNALDAYEIKSVVARNGKEALSQLDKDAAIELVLMDIMMPVMGGYEAMQKIRQDARFKKLPIIALTAKAMKGDQERCLAAGANDYLPKPVRLEQLTSLLKVWLPQRV